MVRKIGHLYRSLLFFSFITILGISPLSMILYSSFQYATSLDALKTRLFYLEEKALLTRKDRIKKKEFLNAYSEYDPYFLNHHIESLALSLKEKSELEKIATHPAFQTPPAINKRLDYLKKENTLLFKEESTRTSPSIKETEEKLSKSVEIDLEDLKQLLIELEGVKIENASPSLERPQIFITDFFLKRKTYATFEVYDMSLSLLKREFLEVPE